MAKTSAVSPEQAKQIEAALRQRSVVAADAEAKPSTGIAYQRPTVG